MLYRTTIQELSKRLSVQRTRNREWEGTGKGMDQHQIPAQIELGEGRDDATEDQEGEKGHDGKIQQAMGQDIPETLHALKVGQNPIEDDEDGKPEKDPHQAQEIKTDPVLPGLCRQSVVPKGQKTRPKQGKGAVHGASPGSSDSVRDG
jgi:hypothetical protein